MAYDYFGITPDVALRDRGWVDNTIGSLQGKYGAGDVNGLAQEISNNVGGVSFQEIQARLAQGAAQPQATGGGGGGGGYNNAAAIAGFDQAIGNVNAGLNRLGAQLNSGYSSIDASYQNAINQLTAGKNTAERNYNENVQSTKTDYVSGKNQIGAQAGNTLNSLRRLLGLRGAGGSSSYEVSAPGAVARQSSLQRNEIGSVFGKNMKALDQSWGDFMTGYNNEVSSADNQRANQRRSLENQIENSRAGLLQQLAQLASQKAIAQGGNGVVAAQPYIDQANQALDRSANYRVDPINFKVGAYSAPSLGSYTYDQVAPTYQGQAAGNDYYSPYLAALLGKKQQNVAAG